MEAELRLSEIEWVLTRDPKEINQSIADAAMGRERMVRDLDIKRQGVANQPLNIPDIVMSSMGNHQYASPAAIKEALNLAGIMQQQQEMEATRPTRRELQQAQVSQAQTGAEQAKENLGLSKQIKGAKVRSAEAGAAYSEANLEKLRADLESSKQSFSPADLAAIAEDGPKALAGMNKSRRSEAMKIVQLQVNTENMLVQKELMKLKQNAKPGISGTILTNSRILAENASKAMDDLRKDIRMAKAVKSSNPEMAKNLGYDIPQMEKDLKKWEKDLEKYKGILDQALGEGSGNTFDTKTKTFR